MLVCEISWNIIHHRSDASSWHQNKGEKMLEGEVHETGGEGGVQREFGSQKLKSQWGGGGFEIWRNAGKQSAFRYCTQPYTPAGSLQFLVNLQTIFYVNLPYYDKLHFLGHVFKTKVKLEYFLTKYVHCLHHISSLPVLFAVAIFWNWSSSVAISYHGSCNTTRSIWGKRKTAIDRFVFFFAHQYLW